MRRDIITISIRLSDEEQALLDKLLKKYGHGWPLPKTFSDRFRYMLKNINNRPWEHVFEAKDSEAQVDDDWPNDANWFNEETETEEEQG